MKEFKRRRNIERAERFRVEYFAADDVEVMIREFESHKSAMQWVERNVTCTLNMMTARTLALIDESWEPYTSIGKKLITLSDLEHEVRLLREEFNSSFLEK